MGRAARLPWSTAALHGHLEIAEFLIAEGADVTHTNRDGNTPLHVAAFLCESEVIDLLLAHGASVETENERGETPIDVVSGEWSSELAGFYEFISQSANVELDIDQIEQSRPEIAARLKEASPLESTKGGMTTDGFRLQ